MEQNIPARQLRTNRGMVKTVLLNVITLGIYSLVFYTKVGKDVNTVASRYDGKKTMNYCLAALVFTIITLGIVPIVWFHRVSKRIGRELDRRGIEYSFGAGSFWLWNTLGVLIVVGPFIYLYKLCTAMNLLCGDYNKVG